MKLIGSILAFGCVVGLTATATASPLSIAVYDFDVEPAQLGFALNGNAAWQPDAGIHNSGYVFAYKR